MAAQARRDRPIAAALLDFTPERLISACRIALALFGFAALWLDSGSSTPEASPTFVILSAFLAYSIAIAVFTRFTVFDSRIQVAIHAIDISILAALMHYTEGTASPFFVFFTFALFSATLRWNWAGALVTAFILVGLYLTIAAATYVEAESPNEFAKLVTRGGYLLLAGVILAYLGALRERARQRIARLADWPTEPVGETREVLLKDTLFHALAVTGATRVIVFWEESNEPHLNMAMVDAGGFRQERRPPRHRPILAPELADTQFVVRDAQDGVALTASGRYILTSASLAADVVSEFRIRSALVASSSGPHVRCHVLLDDLAVVGDDGFSLSEIVASHIRTQIEHHILHRKLAAAAADRERERLARDLHDTTLQALAAIALQLHAMRQEAPERLQPGISELQEIVADQQQTLRDFVTLPRERPAWELPIAPQLMDTLREVESLWGCRGSCEVKPNNAKLPLNIGDQVNLILKEAAANAVRHGGASHIAVTATVEGDLIKLGIRDNGHGPDPPGDGEIAPQAAISRSLAARVNGLGGSISSALTEDGVELTFVLPL